jgi:pyruvate/2-oxoacid:ferredoxin oxidoreductase alpha subunit
MQFYCSSNQEVLDTVIQAFKVSEKLLIPSMVILDAFTLSHTYEVVDLPEQEKVDEYLPPFKPLIRITPDEPHAFGGLTSPEHYFELRYKVQKAMEEGLALIEETGREFEKMFGRYLGIVEDYRCEDAELILITSGTMGSTAKIAVDELREEGIKAGNLRIKVFRPFPFDIVRNILKGAQKVAVVDRNISYGHHGMFYQEVKSAMYGHSNGLPLFGFITGLGGRDITPTTFREIANYALEKEKPEEEITWIGVNR